MRREVQADFPAADGGGRDTLGSARDETRGEVRDVAKKNVGRTEVVREFSADELEKDENGEYVFPDDITYTEFLHFTHPELSAEELAQQVAKERRNAWLVRFMVLALALIVILVIALIVTS